MAKSNQSSVLTWAATIASWFLALVLLIECSLTHAETLVQHQEYQAVDSAGRSTFNAEKFPFSMTGIVLNNPGDMLDPTANFSAIPFHLGGQWQVFIQAYGDPQDFGGTCLWVGQNYGNLLFKYNPPSPMASYSNTEWNTELARLNYPEGVQSPALAAGDVITVTAAVGLEYKGKMNVNENHDKDPENDFTITRIQTGQPLPVPSQLALSQLMDTGKTFYFDPSRQSGPEFYQATRVTLLNVRLSGGIWANGEQVWVTDDLGREFALRLGLDPGFTTAPQGAFNITGILDQESSGSSVFTNGYFLWVMRPQDVTPGGQLNHWIGSVGQSWGDAAHWLTGAAPNAADAVARFTLPGGEAVHVDDDVTVGQLELASPSGSVLSGSGTLTLKTTALAGQPRMAALRVAAGRHEVSVPMTLDNEAEVAVAADSQLVLSGPIGGSGALYKRGAGMLTISAVNTYAGGTILQEGTLNVINAAALPAGQSLMIGNGATVVLAVALQTTSSSEARAVPEPGTGLLAALVALGLFSTVVKKPAFATRCVFLCLYGGWSL